MKVKTFHALSMQDALRTIKEELGPDAIILSAKEVREGGRILKAFNRPVLEVMAASDQDTQRVLHTKEAVPQTSLPVKPSDAVPDATQSTETFRQTLREVLKPARRPSTQAAGKRAVSLKSSAVPVKPTRTQHLHRVMHELGSVLEDLSQTNNRAIGSQRSSMLLPLRHSLVAQGMNPSTVDLLLNEACQADHTEALCDHESIRLALQRAITKRVRTSGLLQSKKGYPSVGLLIGPSGAGKTAAVAKLASHYRLDQQKSVALVTFDTHRDTAVEQLRRYAKLVGVPFACALSARQVYEGLRRYTQVDLVLIDMPGIGPSDLALADELQRFLPKESVTTQLVFAASTREQELCRITNSLHDLPRLCLLFTKLDETESFGTIFEVAHQTGVPLSYWSVGRRVPGDIEIASPEHLATVLTAERSATSQRVLTRSVHSSEAAPTLMEAGTHHG